jgi:pimeloyl-ACP methyl ester carboxylesterase
VNIEPVIGRYLNLDVEGASYRIYFEEAGQGIPLLCLHTAGADSRQYRHLMTDTAVTDRFRVIAFDLPYHGRSNPPDRWWLEKYRLTTKSYIAFIRAVWHALELDRPVVVGCSMGGAIVLKLAVDFQRELRGIVGLESSGIRARALQRVPSSSGDSRRRARGELHLRAVRAAESRVERERELVVLQPGRPRRVRRRCALLQHRLGRSRGNQDDRHQLCKVSLLTGEFDYSATPDMTRQVASAIPGSRLVIMKGIGHFPMIENYPLFRGYLLPELDFMRERS